MSFCDFRTFTGSSLTSLVLNQDDVHLWCASLDPPHERVEALWRILSPDERERAARLRFTRDRRRSVVSRGLLRTLLAGYTGIAPDRLQFSYSPRGKPALAGEAHADRLQFNLAHSDELVLMAIARVRPLGVDLEIIRPMPDLEKFAQRFFSEIEWAALRRVPEVERTKAFFNCWTRKEAYVKALGDGLRIPLDRFAVTLAPGQAAKILAVGGDTDDASAWSLVHLEPMQGYVGALAIRGAGWRVAGWKLDMEAECLGSDPATTRLDQALPIGSRLSFQGGMQ